MGLLRMIFWVVLFLASTFAFTVLFEHGPEGYGTNAQAEWNSLMKSYHDLKDGKTDKPTGK